MLLCVIVCVIVCVVCVVWVLCVMCVICVIYPPHTYHIPTNYQLPTNLPTTYHLPTYQPPTYLPGSRGCARRTGRGAGQERRSGRGWAGSRARRAPLQPRWRSRSTSPPARSGRREETPYTGDAEGACGCARCSEQTAPIQAARDLQPRKRVQSWATCSRGPEWGLR